MVGTASAISNDILRFQPFICLLYYLVWCFVSSCNLLDCETYFVVRIGVFLYFIIPGGFLEIVFVIGKCSVHCTQLKPFLDFMIIIRIGG